MKTKDFFKSNAFKCILVLLLITLVCGTVITVFSFVFAVSDEERLERSLHQIYGETLPAYEQKAVLAADGTEADENGRNERTVKLESTEYEAVVKQVIVDEEGRWLVKSKGSKCGFQGGSVTVWVVMRAGTSLEKIENIVLVGNETDSSQTLIGQFDAAFFAKYAADEATVSGGGYFRTGRMTAPSEWTEVVSAGATYTSNAMDVAVNGAMAYVRERLAATEGGTV